jgi:hypothetical protein
MIFSHCRKCEEPIICYYEAGDEPVGALEEIVCEKCGAKNYVQRISFGGVTYSEEEAQALPGFRKIN